jgi:hypothetical protein
MHDTWCLPCCYTPHNYVVFQLADEITDKLGTKNINFITSEHIIDVQPQNNHTPEIAFHFHHKIEERAFGPILCLFSLPYTIIIIIK